MPDRPASPWTPSYAVTIQGGPSLSTSDIHIEREAEPDQNLSKEDTVEITAVNEPEGGHALAGEVPPEVQIADGQEVSI